jgi:hypothetical protein
VRGKVIRNDLFHTITMDENSWYDYLKNHISVYGENAEIESIARSNGVPSSFLEELLP